MEEEYVVYESFIVACKGQLPDVEYRYLSSNIPNATTTNIPNKAYRFFDLIEAKEIAELLGMHVGKIELKVSRVY